MSNGDANTRWLDQLRGLAVDLSRIEVNTIYKENMSCGAMGELRDGLCEIGRQYLSYLRNSLDVKDELPVDEKYFTEWINFFKGVCDEATDRYTELKGEEIFVSKLPLDDQKIAYTLQRIASQSESVREALERARGRLVSDGGMEEKPHFNLGSLNAGEITPIRKAWELGLEQVVVQSVIHLDGDVITRISETAIARDPTPLLQVHNNSVSQALNYWGTIFDVVRKFIGIRDPDAASPADKGK